MPFAGLVRVMLAHGGRVYDAWTNLRSVMEWMIPMPGGRTTAKLEPRVGGRFQIDMVSEGKTYPHEGSISVWSVRG